MRILNAFVGSLVLVASLTPAVAKDYAVKFSSPVVVAGTELQPGRYTLVVTQGQVVIQGTKTSVVALATVEQVENRYEATAVKYTTVEGRNLAQEIRIGGTSTKVVFPNDALRAASEKKVKNGTKP